MQLSPEALGQWYYAGIDTLIFEPEGRLRGATEYTVTIPAGTVSVAGHRLEETYTHRFQTPPLRIQSSIPALRGGSILNTDAIFLVNLNQKVNPNEVLPFLRLIHDGQELALALLTESQILASRYKENWLRMPERCLLLKPARPLPLDAELKLVLKAGAPSAEGKRTKDEDQMVAFKTIAPFSASLKCGKALCDPDFISNIELNNFLAQGTFDPDAVESSEESEAGWSSV